MARTVEGAEGPVTIGARRMPDEAGQLRVTIGDQELLVKAVQLHDGGLRIQLPDGRELRTAVTLDRDVSWVSIGGETSRVKRIDPSASATQDEGSLEAPMPGKVLQVKVAVGDVVEAGDVLLILEAMKMEHGLKAPYAGTVTALAAGEGDRVNPGTTLVTIEA